MKILASTIYALILMGGLAVQVWVGFDIHNRTPYSFAALAAVLFGRMGWKAATGRYSRRLQ